MIGHTAMRKKDILRVLRQGKPISGETLAKEMGVSRTAVWKYINKLRLEGYQIRSSPRIGYALSDDCDILLPEDIKEGTKSGWRLDFHREVGSTQEVARELAIGGASEEMVVVAEKQSNGRGRLGRSWVSPLGGVYLSFILRPQLKPLEVLRLPLLAGVAVTEALVEVSGLQPSLKWPNDVLLAGMKVAGILCELDAEADSINHIILGIGVNVNNDTPRELKGIATSLKEEYGVPLSRAEFIGCLLDRMESLYLQSQHEGFRPILAAWKKLSSTLGSEVTVSSPGKEIEGTAVDIDRNGALLIRKSDGELVRVVAGDVSLRKDGRKENRWKS
jgi:BirA family biotin operon repressor/biotin-[acetyl-CoA-carboxylase] ligase